MPSCASFVAAAHGQARNEPVRASCSREMRLTLLDAFELSAGGTAVNLPMSAQRLLAFVALHERPILRQYVAGSLWLDTSDDRAGANLRSTLWRLRRAGCDSVEATSSRLRLAPGVVVDIRETVSLARRVLDNSMNDEDPGLAGMLLSGDLLPDWYEDWVADRAGVAPSATPPRARGPLRTVDSGHEVPGGGRSRTGGCRGRAAPGERSRSTDQGAPSRGKSRRGCPPVLRLPAAPARPPGSGALPADGEPRARADRQRRWRTE